MKRKTILAVAAVGAAGLALSACTTLGLQHPVGNRSVPEPAKPVELDRYLGQWYELARYDQRFQRGCNGTTANYSLRPDGVIRVVNRCRKTDGRISEAEAKAKVVDTRTNAKLKVSFFGPFWGDYWVLDRADDYSWAIVGEGSGRYLWILSRTATPGEERYQDLVRRTAAMGYDTAPLIRTVQP